MPSLAQLPGVLQLHCSLLLPGPPSCPPLAVLVRRRKSWWLFLPPEVSACAGGRNRQRWLVPLEPWSPLPPGEGGEGLGEQRAQEKIIQELQGKERLLVQNSALP